MEILRRIKNRWKNIIQAKEQPKPKKSADYLGGFPKKIFQNIFRKEKKEEPPRKVKEILGAQEMAVERTKFSQPETIAVKTHRPMPQELPGGYGRDKIVLQTRDPWWLHAYWEITSDTWERLKQRLKDAFFSAKKVIRVYDISQIIFNGQNAQRFFDIDVSPESNNWYIDVGDPGRSWCVDYGIKLPTGEFITIVRSNTAHTPLDGPSWVTDEEWMIPDEMFGRLYGMGFGLGQSSPVGKAWQSKEGAFLRGFGFAGDYLCIQPISSTQRKEILVSGGL